MSLINYNNGTNPAFYKDIVKENFFDNSERLQQQNRFPAINIEVTKNSLQIDVAAPGWKKEDFVIQLSDDVITIEATIENSNNADNTNEIIRREFVKDSFKRSFTIIKKLNASQMATTYYHGILTIIIPLEQ